MTRNFEEEYKKYADSSVPDLWGRIEAAIDAGTPAGTVTEAVEPAPAPAADKRISRANKVIKFNARYGAILAACACLLVTIGVIGFLRSMSKATSSYEAASAPMDAAPQAEAYEEAAAEESVTDEAVAADDDMYAAAETGGMTEEYEAAEEAVAESAGESAAAATAPAADNMSEALTAEGPDERREATLNVDNSYKNAIGNKATHEAADEAAEVADEAAPAEYEEAAAEASPAEYEEAASDEAAPAEYEEAADNETASDEEYAGDSAAEEASSAAAGVTMSAVCTVTDTAGLEKDHMIRVTVYDPVDSEFTKGEVLTLNIDEEAFERLKEILSGSRGRKFTMEIQQENNGRYTLLSAES